MGCGIIFGFQGRGFAIGLKGCGLVFGFLSRGLAIGLMVMSRTFLKIIQFVNGLTIQNVLADVSNEALSVFVDIVLVEVENKGIVICCLVDVRTVWIRKAVLAVELSQSKDDVWLHCRIHVADLIDRNSFVALLGHQLEDQTMMVVVMSVIVRFHGDHCQETGQHDHELHHFFLGLCVGLAQI